LIPYIDVAFKLIFISATVVIVPMQEASRSKVIAHSHVLVIPPKPVELGNHLTTYAKVGVLSTTPSMPSEYGSLGC
jgi:hypothetical protein